MQRLSCCGPTAHAKTEAERAKKQKDRSESTDGKGARSIFVASFIFRPWELSNWRQVSIQYSKKTPERGRDRSPSGGRSRTPGPSASPSSKICYSLKNTGTCSRNSCPFTHEAGATTPKDNAKGNSKAKTKPKAEAKSEVKGTPRGKAKPQPTAPTIRLCRAWNPLAPAIQKKSALLCHDESDCSSLDSDVDSDVYVLPVMRRIAQLFRLNHLNV